MVAQRKAGMVAGGGMSHPWPKFVNSTRDRAYREKLKTMRALEDEMQAKLSLTHAAAKSADKDWMILELTKENQKLRTLLEQFSVKHLDELLREME